MPEYAISAWVKVYATIIIEAETPDNALTLFMDGEWTLDGDEERVDWDCLGMPKEIK